MPPFKGFPAGKVRLVAIPAPFFSDLLPQIDHLGELKVTLYALWFIEQIEGTIRYIREEDFVSDRRFIAGLGRTEEIALAALRESLERCVNRGTLLCARVSSGDTEQTYYFMNTPRGKAALLALQKGDWSPSEEPHQPVELILDQPNIYRLYEDNIGPLTPMIAETLREAELTYPSQWVEEAVRIAVENNVRRWRYVDAILRSWREEGRDDPNRRYTEKDRRRYVEGPFADFIEH
jgi:DNA replication protein